MRRGSVVVVLLLLWSRYASMDVVAVAHGRLVPQTWVKIVQPAAAGIVREILVKEGSVVGEGQVVLRLDDTVTRATLGVVRSQLDELTAREARLLAERDGADAIGFPAALSARRPAIPRPPARGAFSAGP